MNGKRREYTYYRNEYKNSSDTGSFFYLLVRHMESVGMPLFGHEVQEFSALKESYGCDQRDNSGFCTQMFIWFFSSEWYMKN